MQRRTHDEGFKNLLEEVLKLIETQFATIQWIGLAARWAELKLRNVQQEVTHERQRE
jgi:hypothetical protein